MLKYMEKLCFLLLLVAALGKTEVTVENGGYNALVSFSQNVPPEEGKELLEKLKETLSLSSKVLYDSIKLRFNKVTVEIPSSWDISEWEIQTEDVSRYEKPKTDILVDSTGDSAFGKFPVAHQHGSCGVPGHQIVIPTNFLNDSNAFPKGVSLAREWLKYRYGVFEENGYFGDALYPLYYVIPGSDPNDVKITECTNVDVTYNFLDQTGEDNCSTVDKTISQRLDSKECRIEPDEESTENVTSSIMYFQENIHTMEHICGKEHNHNSRSPNKQNALCKGQSIWDVMKESSDFPTSEEEATGDFADIEYVYVRESKPKIVVAWESTKQLSKKDQIILNAIKKIMIDLPPGSMFNGFPFKDRVTEDRDYTLRELNTLADQRDAEQTISSDFLLDTNGNINSALTKALEVLSSVEGDSKPEDTIILITKSGEVVEETVLQSLKESKACIKLLIFVEDTVPDGMRKSVSELPCATLSEIPLEADKDEETFEKLIAAVETILSPPVVDDKETRTVQTQYLTHEAPILMRVDDSTVNVTFWVFSKKDTDSFALEFNGEAKTNEIKTTTIGNTKAMLYSPPGAGYLKFAFPHEVSELILTQVRTTFKAGKYFNGEVITYDTSNSSSEVQMPVIIYAFIRYGSYPVQNARVSAVIQQPNSENVTLELSDDGRGDPDITKNDGVYSRYFIKFSGTGEYKVTVTVTNGLFTRIGDDSTADYKTCCGSSVKVGATKLGFFSKEFTTSFHVTNDPPDEGYKPSRILDLRIDEVTNDKIVLKWTAPGEQADDDGTASEYEIKLSSDEENGTVSNEMARILDKPLPMKHGTEQRVTIQILTKTEALYVGISAVNKKGEQSDMSNKIQIFTPGDQPSEITPTTVAFTKESPLGTIIGSTITGILIMICIVSGIIYYFRRRSQKKAANKKPETYEIEESKDNQEPSHSFKAVDFPIKSAPVKNTRSFPIVLYTHDQIKDIRDKNKNPPLHKSNVPPKAWASLDAMSNARTRQGERDTKSLDSSSTISATDDSETNQSKDSYAKY